MNTGQRYGDHMVTNNISHRQLIGLVLGEDTYPLDSSTHKHYIEHKLHQFQTKLNSTYELSSALGAPPAYLKQLSDLEYALHAITHTDYRWKRFIDDCKEAISLRLIDEIL